MDCFIWKNQTIQRTKAEGDGINSFYVCLSKTVLHVRKTHLHNMQVLKRIYPSHRVGRGDRHKHLNHNVTGVQGDEDEVWR